MVSGSNKGCALHIWPEILSLKGRWPIVFNVFGLIAIGRGISVSATIFSPIRPSPIEQLSAGSVLITENILPQIEECFFGSVAKLI